MPLVELLDAGPLGLVTNLTDSPESARCNARLEMLLARGIRAVVPEIADYEIRRELLRAGKTTGGRQLGNLKVGFDS